MERIEAVLFDWGGVVIDNPGPGLMAHCAAALGVSVDDYIRAHERHGEPIQTGQIDEVEFWRRVCADLDRPAPTIASLWGEAFRAVYSPRQAVLDLAGRLQRAGTRTALLSNTEPAAVTLFDELSYDVFDAGIFSCVVGVAKPDRHIYQIAAGKLRAGPAQCVFIDDKQVFVDGAEAVGMKGILYEDFEQVCRALRDLGVPGTEAR